MDGKNAPYAAAAPASPDGAKKIKKILDKSLTLRQNLLYNTFCQFDWQALIAELCKGSTTDSDSVCEGSNPSSAATENRLFFEKTVFLLPFRGFPVTAI